MDFTSFQKFDFVSDTFMSSKLFLFFFFNFSVSVFTAETSMEYEHIEWVFRVFTNWSPQGFISSLCYWSLLDLGCSYEFCLVHCLCQLGHPSTGAEFGKRQPCFF